MPSKKAQTAAASWRLSTSRRLPWPGKDKGIAILEGKARVKLNLAPSAYGGEYSADVVGETTRCIREDGISVSSQGKRTLRITWDCKIRMVEQIVGFRSKCNLRAFPQL